MISETLEPFLNAGLAALLWGFVAFLWMLAPEVIRDNTWFGQKLVAPPPKDYAIAGLVILVLCALTFSVLMWTLTIMGV